MTDILSAVNDDYNDYVNMCDELGVKPLGLCEKNGENFYDTKEWKEVEKIPHQRGCLGMALDQKLRQNQKSY